MSTAIAAPHTVKASKGDHIPGTWRGVCTCGWSGILHGSRGARAAALTDAYTHEAHH